LPDKEVNVVDGKKAVKTVYLMPTTGVGYDPTEVRWSKGEDFLAWREVSMEIYELSDVECRRIALEHAVELAEHLSDIDSVANILSAAKEFESYLKGESK